VAGSFSSGGLAPEPFSISSLPAEPFHALVSTKAQKPGGQPRSENMGGSDGGSSPIQEPLIYDLLMEKLLHVS
jgi:hypothetical protein